LNELNGLDCIANRAGLPVHQDLVVSDTSAAARHGMVMDEDFLLRVAKENKLPRFVVPAQAGTTKNYRQTLRL
jgi:hypothetical protein